MDGVLSADLIMGFALGIVGTLLLARRIPFLSRQNITAHTAQASHLEELDLLKNNIAAAVIVRTLPTGTSFCTPYTEVLTGYTQDEVLEHNGDFFESLVLQEDKDRYHRALLISELGEDYLVRFRIKHKSGIKLWLESRMVPIADAVGNVSAVMSVTIDVTDTLNSQRKIEQQNRDLSDFSYMVSHDLKSPIFTIKGMATALQEDYAPKLNDDAQQLIRFILEAAGRLESLVSSILQYALVSSAEHEAHEVRLQNVIHNVTTDLGEQIKACGAQVATSLDLPPISGNEIQLYQLFSNLVGNSLKYRATDRTPEILIRSVSVGLDTAVIEVKDNGIGIPANKLDDIFRPFHRAHGGDVQGNGIGLACVKKIIDQHGGKITVQSTVGHGTSFFIELPIALHAPRTDTGDEDLERCFERT